MKVMSMAMPGEENWGYENAIIKYDGQNISEPLVIEGQGAAQTSGSWWMRKTVAQWFFD